MNESSATSTASDSSITKVVPKRRSSMFKIMDNSTRDSSTTTKLCSVRYPPDYAEELEKEIKGWSEVSAQAAKCRKKLKKQLKAENLNICVEDVEDNMVLPDLEQYVRVATAFINKRVIMKHEQKALQNYIEVKEADLPEKITLFLKSEDKENSNK